MNVYQLNSVNMSPINGEAPIVRTLAIFANASEAVEAAREAAWNYAASFRLSFGRPADADPGCGLVAVTCGPMTWTVTEFKLRGAQSPSLAVAQD